MEYEVFKNKIQKISRGFVKEDSSLLDLNLMEDPVRFEGESSITIFNINHAGEENNSKLPCVLYYVDERDKQLISKELKLGIWPKFYKPLYDLVINFKPKMFWSSYNLPSTICKESNFYQEIVDIYNRECLKKGPYLVFAEMCYIHTKNKKSLMDQKSKDWEQKAIDSFESQIDYYNTKLAIINGADLSRIIANKYKREFMENPTEAILEIKGKQTVVILSGFVGGQAPLDNYNRTRLIRDIEKHISLFN